MKALKTEPTSIPYSKYLVLRRDIWQTCWLPEGYDLRLDAESAASIANARGVLRNDSTLDASQAEAVVDSLTREVSLI